MEKPIAHAHIKFPRELWHEFQVYTRTMDTTASKLIRNFVRKTLGKTEME